MSPNPLSCLAAARGGLRACGVALVLLALPPLAEASGQRGIRLTREAVASFASLDAERLASLRPVYIGTADGRHLFLLLQTVVAGGMPSDQLTTYSVAVSAVSIEGGWDARVEGQYVEALNCPGIRRVSAEPAAGASPGSAPAEATPVDPSSTQASAAEPASTEAAPSEKWRVNPGRPGEDLRKACGT